MLIKLFLDSKILGGIVAGVAVIGASPIGKDIGDGIYDIGQDVGDWIASYAKRWF